MNTYFEMLTFFFWENYARVSHKSVSANLTQIGDKFSWQVNLWFIVPKWHEIELKWRERWEMFFEYFYSNRMLHHFEPEPYEMLHSVLLFNICHEERMLLPCSFQSAFFFFKHHNLLHTPTYTQQVTHDSLPTTNQVTPIINYSSGKQWAG